MFRIGEFSKLSKTTIKALRYYDEIGLLKPGFVDKFTSYRFYTSKQLIELHRINSLRQIGISIDKIKLILSGAQMEEVLFNRKTEIENALRENIDCLSRIEFILSKKESEVFMNYQAIMKELPQCEVYSKKMLLASYDDYFQVIPKLGKQVTERYPDIKCTVPEYCFVRYLDGEYKENNIKIEFCEAIDKKREDFDGIVFKTIPKTSAVSVLHKGAYANLRLAYSYIFQWIEENGYSPTDVPRESYIDGIWNCESEDEWLTELQVPVIKK